MKRLCAKTRMDTDLCGCNPCETTISGEEETDYAELIYCGDDLNDKVIPPLVQLVEGLIPEGSVVLAGAPKVGKSWFSLDLCLNAAAGGRFLGGIQVPERDVLYLALEDGHRRIQSRARQLLGRRRIPRRFKYVLRVPKADAVGLINHWLTTLEDPSTAVVVIDTGQKIRPPSRAGVSVYEQDYDFGSVLKTITESHPGMVCIVVTHTRKAGSADFVEQVTGSNGFTGAADTILVLQRERTSEEGTLSVTSRDGREGVYRIERAGSSWVLSGGDLDRAAQAAEQSFLADGLGDLARDILGYVAAHPDSSPAEIKKVLPDTTPGAVDKALKRLHDSGRLIKTGRGRYRHPTLHVVPQTDDDLDLDLDNLGKELD